MDEDSSPSVDQLLERARQRRAKLSKMLNETTSQDSSVPRKRRTPLSEDLSENLPAPLSDDSPKRTCVRDSEMDVHLDTPAISSVKSRMDTLMQRRAAWGSESPTLDVAPPTRSDDTPIQDNPDPQSCTTNVIARKNRLAGLARMIDNWEDESSVHPTIPDTNAKPSTPRKHTVKPLVDYSPVNSPSVNAGQPVPRGDTSQSVDAPPRCESAVKKRLDSWEQKISQDQKGATAKKGPPVMKDLGGVDAARSINTTPARVQKVPGENNELSSVAKVRDTWQRMDENNTPKKEDEPTAYSVSARMSAWEKMTAENQIGQIKRVDPNIAKVPSPAKPRLAPAVTTHPSHPTTPIKATVAAKPALPDTMTPAKTLTPSKSMVNCGETSSPASPIATKYHTLSPSKASCAMKAIQQRLVEQTQVGKSGDVAQRLRDERMAELKQLKNRWKNGILKEPGDDEGQKTTVVTDVPDNGQSTIEMATKFEQREATRLRSKEEFDQKLELIGLPNDCLAPPAPPLAPPAPPLAPLAPPLAPPMPPSMMSNQSKGQSTDQAPDIKVTCKPPPAPPAAPSIETPRDTVKSLHSLVHDADAVESDTDRESCSSATNPSAMLFDDSFNSDIDSDRVGGYDRTPQAAVAFREPIESFADDASVRSDQTSPSSSLYGQFTPADEYLDDEDISMAAFVPESVRRESMHMEQMRARAGSISGAPPPQVLNHAESVTSLTSITSAESEVSRDASHDVGYTSDDLASEESDVVSSLPSQNDQTPQPAPRRRELVGSTETSVQMPGHESPLVYSISMYRSQRFKEKRQAPKATIVRTKVQASDLPESVCAPVSPPRCDKQSDLDKRIEELQAQIYQEQAIISQTSNALNQCCSINSTFAGSSAQVECNRVLLVATQRRNVYVSEIQRLRAERTLEPWVAGPRGSLTISDIRLPLKKEFVSKIGSSNDSTTHYFILLIKHQARVIVTEMISTHDPRFRGSLDFSNLIKINNIPGSFKLNVDVYSMALTRDQQVKDNKKKTRTPKKPTKSVSSLPLQSPGGPNVVRTTDFVHVTSVSLHMGVVDQTNFQLTNVPYKCPLYGSMYMRLTSVVETNVEEKGFLTMFEDVSGLGAWHRRWCVLSVNKLCFWRYPDDVSRKDPICYVDLKRCITDKVGLIPRDVCARPNTFEFVTVHQPRKGEHDTLVAKTSSHGTQIRHMMSADTKEERLVWCSQINKALLNLRTWNSDALKPSRKNPAPDAPNPTRQRLV